MSQLTYNAIVKNGHIEIDNLPLPDNTKVHIVIKSDTKGKKKIDKFLSMMPKHKLGKELFPVDREHIYE